MAFKNPGAPITPPITTIHGPSGSNQKRLGGSYKSVFSAPKKAGPRGRKSSRRGR